jgi:hypothetical protein
LEVKKLNSAEVKAKINDACGVLEARKEYFFEGEITEEDYDSLGKTLDILEKWRDGDEVRYLPESAGQAIWLKQFEQTQVQG